MKKVNVYLAIAIVALGGIQLNGAQSNIDHYQFSPHHVAKALQSCAVGDVRDFLKLVSARNSQQFVAIANERARRVVDNLDMAQTPESNLVYINCLQQSLCFAANTLLQDDQGEFDKVESEIRALQRKAENAPKGSSF
jgi:hypothetical protein